MMERMAFWANVAIWTWAVSCTVSLFAVIVFCRNGLKEWRIICLYVVFALALAAIAIPQALAQRPTASITEATGWMPTQVEFKGKAYKLIPVEKEVKP